MAVQVSNSERVDLLRTYFAENPHYHYQYAISLFQNIPGLVGFWPMSSVQTSTGNVYDLSGQARTLTYNGNPTFNVYNSVAPYIDLDGTGDFLSRADEADLDITGAETINAASVRGLTVGGWFWWDVAGAEESVISKYTTTGNQRGFILEKSSSDFPKFVVSVDGAATTSATSTAAVATGGWYFLVGRFTPSTELAVFQNNTKYTNTTSIPASVFVNTAPLLVGGINAGALLLLNGRSSLCYLSNQALPDAFITSLYNSTKSMFSVA